MRPIIGLNCNVTTQSKGLNLDLAQAYTVAIERAGGMPILLPPAVDGDLVEAQVGLISGLVLVGGPDYDPKLYDAEQHPKTVLIDPTRAAYDIKLANAALRRALPILGICGGLQLVNILRDGTLDQHLPEVPGVTAEHANSLNDDAHDVTIETGSRLAATVGESQLTVNSHHHQAAARIGRDLRVAARSTDGVVEAIESTQPEAFLMCVQWHPERLVDHPRHLALFEALVQAASRFK